MWHALKDFANGHFYEPRFYGQAYNTMLESLIAVPLFIAGIEANFALPIITSLLAIFPFVLISFHVFIKKSSKLGLLILSIPLILPTNYTLISTMPRGFVTGIFVSSFMYLCIDNKTLSKSFFFASFLLIAANSINPNSLLFSIPCIVYIALNNVKNKTFYTYAGIGIAAGMLFDFSLNLFYKINPNYNLHRYTLSYSLKNMLLGAQNLNLYFKDIAIVFAHSGILMFVVFIIIALLFASKKELNKAVCIGIIPLLILLTFSVTSSIRIINIAVKPGFESSSDLFIAQKPLVK